jgi:glycosyltransferase involved in cell wall biosynthesis
MNENIVVFSAHRSEKIEAPLRETDREIVMVSPESDGLIDKFVKCAIAGQRTMRAEDPDIVIGDHAGIASFVAVVLSTLYRRPFVLRLGGNIWKINDEKFKEHRAEGEWKELFAIVLIKTMNMFTFYRTDGYLAISETVKRAIVTNTRASDEQVEVIGVPVDRSKFEDGDGTIVRSQHDLIGKQILLTVTNLRFRGKFEGISRSLDQIVELLEQYDNLVYLVAGEGVYRKKLQRTIDAEVEDALMRERIKCVGFVDNVEDYYDAADVMVYVSFNEGFGNIIQEAQVAGCPVVANDTQGMSDQIADGENGLLINIDTPGELQTAVGRLLDDQEFHTKIGEQAREHVIKIADPIHIGNQMQTSIDRLTAGRR